jgi:proline iminopeptidase
MGKSLAAFAFAFTFTFSTACSLVDPLDEARPGQPDEETAAQAPNAAAPPAQNADLPGASVPAPVPRTTDLHHSEKGDPKAQAVVFIHGGPGANSLMFELTVQDAVAKKGFHVVAYDQRGSTRSPKGTSADYSFARATEDLDDLVSALGLVKPILLGHSFGGLIALHYLEKFPGKAKGAVLVASPIDFPQTYDTTLVQCASRYRMWGRFSDAQKVDSLRAKMFPGGLTGPLTYGDSEIGATIECQTKAMLYFPPMPTQGDVNFALQHGQNQQVQDVNIAVGSGFHANDDVGHASFVSLLAKHTSEVVGIYSPSWDAMFSKTQLATIQANVRAWLTVANAGHFVFMDQPEAFTTTAAQAFGLF